MNTPGKPASTLLPPRRDGGEHRPRTTEEAAWLLIPRLSRALPGLCRDLDGLSIMEVPADVGGGWDAEADLLELPAWSHRDNGYRYLALSEHLAHELWHRRSVRTRFWETPSGRWWLRSLTPAAQEYLDECRAGLVLGHDDEYFSDLRPEAGMPTVLHRVSEELIAGRCGYAASRWLEAELRTGRPLKAVRRGIPPLATRP